MHGMLHVLTFTPRSPAHAKEGVALLRRQRAADDGRVFLLYVLWPQADLSHTPQDAEIARILQSGVMAMNARQADRYYLLIPQRTYNAAARAYMGGSARETLAQLLLTGKTQTAFDAATVAPASLKARFSCALISPLALACTPDVPRRMRAALTPGGCVLAQVREADIYPQSALSRLCRAGFSLAPDLDADAALLARRGFAPVGDDTPALFDLCALDKAQESAPLAPDCVFVRRAQTTLAMLCAQLRSRCLAGGDFRFYLPAVQFALLFLSALLGSPLLAALALLPEIRTLMLPALLPGALLRTALLPLSAAVSLDAALSRLFRASRFVSVRLPRPLFSAVGALCFGALLAALALRSASSFFFLAPVSLFWLSSPLLLPALAAPTTQRIPLDEQDLALLDGMAKDAFSRIPENSPSPRAILAACAACMLSLLEPDETARRAGAALTAMQDAPLQDAAAFDLAALLASAQFLRERMADCDAASRALPAQLEQFAASLPLRQTAGALCAFLLAAREETAGHQTQEEDAMDALFLPPAPVSALSRHPLTLPLTHPHTFLTHVRRGETYGSTGEPADRCLALAAAALHHPFYPLLMRSPVCAPCAAMFMQ